MNPSQEKIKGTLKVISLILIKPVPRQISNNWKLEFIFINRRLIIEHTERKCKIPKKIKLPNNQQDRDMIARELLVKFQMSPKHPLVDLKKAYLKF